MLFVAYGAYVFIPGSNSINYQSTLTVFYGDIILLHWALNITVVFLVMIFTS